VRCIEAPQPYRHRAGDGPSIFLAGGITGCPDWQREVLALLAAAPVVVFNPRRARFDPAAGDTAEQQVGWEHRHLQLADVTLFWFPRSERCVQPIALFELGAVTAQAGWDRRRLVVGAAPDYARRTDVELQLRHRLPGLVVHRQLPDTVSAAVAALPPGQ
jgi:Nucleoside 2-deoxyribosyltransferase like